MKRLLLAAALAGVFAPAFADSYTDSAPVISVRAITERVPVNREECWNEQRRGFEERTVTRQDNGQPLVGPGTVIGAIAGGVIGHQMGSSSGGRDRGTAAGAIIGGLVGNQVDRQNSGPTTTEVERVPVERDVRRCRTVGDVSEVAVGYDVRYRYGGREFMARMPYDPGRRVRVAVDVRPLEEGAPPPPPRAYDRPMPPSYGR